MNYLSFHGLRFSYYILEDISNTFVRVIIFDDKTLKDPNLQSNTGQQKQINNSDNSKNYQVIGRQMLNRFSVF